MFGGINAVATDAAEMLPERIGLWMSLMGVQWIVSLNDGTDTNATTTNTVTLLDPMKNQIKKVKFDQDPGAITEVSASVTLSDYTHQHTI